jgi:16S rRNA C967 or C1407 C5-methylase (RsmB/RsmF family)
MSNITGVIGWHSTYSNQFGAERWKSELFPALKKPVKHVCLGRIASGSDLTLSELETTQTDDGYFIDGASVACALSLNPSSGDNILDMCSAPGGKSTLIARQLKQGSLVCNELSKSRLLRLKQTLAEYANSPKVSLTFTNQDCSSIPSEFTRLGPFDKILLDAACSSDRHILADSELLKRWSPAAVKAQADRQGKMLTTAAALAKPGGLVVYSTCALSDKENDGVIRKFLGRKEGKNFQVEKSNVTEILPGAEETPEGGVLVLPDRTNYGPLYICHLRRNKNVVLS